jgi:L-threonylcarbamoyladenylate synthase
VRVTPVNPTDPRADRLSEAVEVLAGGGLVALPTETVYGLAADPFNVEALLRLNRVKRKPQDSPFLLLLSDPTQVSVVAGRLPECYERLVESFWPGPLTVIVPSAPELPATVGGGHGTVAVRVPGMVLPRRIAAQLGRPITGISANLYGEQPCRTAIEVAGTFGESVEMILDGGPTPGGVASTIVDLTGSKPRLVRAGLVPMASLEPFLPDLVHD